MSTSPRLTARGSYGGISLRVVLRTVYAYELLHEKKLLLNIVTGGGKTAIIGAVIAWLKVCHDLHKFLVLCPNTIVADRLEDDLKDAKVFREFGFFPPGCEHFTNELGLHRMEPGSAPQGIRDSGIVLGNIHQLYQSNINGQRNLAQLVIHAEELAVFNDEAHNTPAAEYDNLLYTLSAKSSLPSGYHRDPGPRRREDAGLQNDRRVFDHGCSGRSAPNHQERCGIPAKG